MMPARILLEIERSFAKLMVSPIFSETRPVEPPRPAGFLFQAAVRNTAAGRLAASATADAVSISVRPPAFTARSLPAASSRTSRNVVSSCPKISVTQSPSLQRVAKESVSVSAGIRQTRTTPIMKFSSVLI
jgi:hypothetical protein